MDNGSQIQLNLGSIKPNLEFRDLSSLKGKSDAEAGKDLALGVCSRCHVVADIQHLPKPPVRNVPSFFALADDPGKTEFYLRSFFRTPHRVMPNFMLTAQEIDDIVAYIFSLKGHRHHRAK